MGHNQTRKPLRGAGLVAAITAIMLALGACSAPSQPSITPSPIAASRPVIDAGFVDRIDGSTATIPLMTAALRLLRGTDNGMHFNTTDAAYQNLINGDKDVIFVTAPSDDELAAAAAAGVQLDVIPIVKDALVFLANTANPVNGLTQKQVQDIYTGKLTNWSQVGGVDQTIIAYQRPEDSGSQTLFEQLAMTGLTPTDAPKIMRPDNMSDLVDMVASYDNSSAALGYSVFYFTQQMYVKDSAKLLAIDGVAPTRQSIANGSYAYPTFYYAVLRQDEADDSTARQLVNWCLSTEGQRVFSAASYVPLSQSDIVEPNDGYGYEGSTPQNTTQSSGTGGPVGKRAVDVGATVSYYYANGTDDPSQYLALTVPGYPAAQAAAIAWLSNIPTPSGADAFANTYADLLDVERYWVNTVDGVDVYGHDSAVFRLSDGHRMALSDFFYDGVNYIDFINTNLLDAGSNQALTTPDFDGMNGEQIAPFTGLPADTLDFGLANGQLVFWFAPNNPFLAYIWEDSIGTSTVPINLPTNLSPYGMAWGTKQVIVGVQTIDHIVSAYGEVDPHDTALNAAIDAWAAKHKSADLIWLFVNLDANGIVVRANAGQRDSDGGLNWLDSVDFDWASAKIIG